MESFIESLSNPGIQIMLVLIGLTALSGLFAPKNK